MTLLTRHGAALSRYVPKLKIIAHGLTIRISKYYYRKYG
jgi:hypothetical protein